MTDAVVAGHSMGGMAAAALAVEHPVVVKERVQGAGTGGDGRPRHRLPPPAARVQRVGDRPAASSIGWSRGRQLGLVTVRGASGKVARPSAVSGLREIVATSTPTARVACLRAMQRMDLRPGLAAVDVPVSVLGGSRDGLVPPPLTAALAAAIPNAELEVLRGAGHMLPLEDPDRLAEIITSHTT